MFKFNFNKKVPIECPKCNYNFKVSLDHLKESGAVKCANCNNEISQRDITSPNKLSDIEKQFIEVVKNASAKA